MFAIYDKVLDSGREELQFTCRWPKDSTKEAAVQFDFDSSLGSFRVHINENAQDEKLDITIEKTDSDRSTLQRFSKCSISCLQGSQAILCPFVYQFFGDYSLDEKIPLSLLSPQDDIFELFFYLTTDAFPRPVQESPVYEHALLAKIFNDPATYDVYFLSSKNNSNVDTDGPEAYIEPVQRTEPEKPYSEEHSTQMTDPSKNMSMEQVNKEETDNCHDEESVADTAKKLGAHKIRLMIVIRFMYTHLVPTRLATFKDEEEYDAGTTTWTSSSSWEKVFIAAERFKVEELQRIACSEVLHGLSEETAIPFLFRTGYLYNDFRAAVVEYVAQKLDRVVTKRPFRDAYRDHPDFRELYGEIFDAFAENTERRRRQVVG
ncbi:hypothetical protein BG006_004956 [Podila minutissima]|uniref:Uncharacterized protein n=1 Tax=Podila minutissima TaxID=64525 RepID=A0A9P5VMD0_9FUNG|nr:hypothetical protein BG006_004956 [Podila minutissima]